MKSTATFALFFLVTAHTFGQGAGQTGLAGQQPAPIPAPGVNPTAPESVEPPPASTAKTPNGFPRTNKNNRRPEIMLSDPVKAASAGAGIGIVEGNADKANQLMRTIQILEDDSALPRRAKTGRTLIIQSTDRDPAALTNAEEDLSVMALILRKATGATQTEERQVVMGIEVFGSSSGARNIYLEGYGALFLLGVRYPLIAPSDVIKETQDKDGATNEWVNARDELLNNGPAVRYQLALDQVYTRQLRQTAEQYDAGKVEDLKTALLQALKNAYHIRILKPTDFVTIAVQGGEIARTEKPEKPGKVNVRNRTETRPAETVMTLRVRASDAIAFGKGELDIAALRERTVINTYFRRGDSSVGTAGFMAPVNP